jgi:hypothetical protein
MRLLHSAVRFVESYVRSSSPASGAPGTLSPRNTFPDEPREVRETVAQQSASRLQIYDDSIPASAQPTTPRHLPEARHRSRLHGSYTAPVTRSRQRPTYEPEAIRGIRGRAQSPSGLDMPGFRGLYGGVENADDILLYQESSRFHESEADHGTHDGGN